MLLELRLSLPWLSVYLVNFGWILVQLSIHLA